MKGRFDVDVTISWVIKGVKCCKRQSLEEVKARRNSQKGLYCICTAVTKSLGLSHS